MLTLAQLTQIRDIAQSAQDDPVGAMQEILELMLPALPPMVRAEVMQVLLAVNPEEIIPDA